MEFPIAKVEDTRALGSLIRLTLNEPTLIICQNIHEATEEALNAFLKNLEEPQENVYFVLTAPSVKKVLSTIVSRCQIIRIKNEGLGIKNEDAEKFLGLTMGEKLSYVDKIKDRDKATEFAENLVNLLHSQIHQNKIQYGAVAKNIEVVLAGLAGLKANGNVNLQLTNLVINLV